MSAEPIRLPADVRGQASASRRARARGGDVRARRWRVGTGRRHAAEPAVLVRAGSHGPAVGTRGGISERPANLDEETSARRVNTELVAAALRVATHDAAVSAARAAPGHPTRSGSTGRRAAATTAVGGALAAAATGDEHQCHRRERVRRSLHRPALQSRLHAGHGLHFPAITRAPTRKTDGARTALSLLRGYFADCVRTHCLSVSGRMPQRDSSDGMSAEYPTASNHSSIKAKSTLFARTASIGIGW